MPNTKIFKNATTIERRGFEIIMTILELPQLTKSTLSKLHRAAALLASTSLDNPPFVADVNQCLNLEQIAKSSLLKTEMLSGTNTPQLYNGVSDYDIERMSDTIPCSTISSWTQG